MNTEFTGDKLAFVGDDPRFQPSAGQTDRKSHLLTAAQQGADEGGGVRFTAHSAKYHNSVGGANFGQLGKSFQQMRCLCFGEQRGPAAQCFLTLGVGHIP